VSRNVNPSGQRKPVLPVPRFAQPGEPDRTRTQHQLPGRNPPADFDLKPLCCRLRTPWRRPAGARNRMGEVMRVATLGLA